MLEDNIRKILNKNFGKEKKHGFKAGEYIYHCPFCNHYKPKLNVSVILDDNNCNKWQCWVCKKSGISLYSLFQETKNYEVLKQLKLLGIPKPNSTSKPTVTTNNTIDTSNDIEFPKGFHKFDYIPTNTEQYEAFKLALTYLTVNRKLLHIDLIRYDIRYTGIRNDKYSNTYIIPSYDSNNKINYLSCRKYINSKYSHIPLSISKKNIGFDNYINWNEKYVVLVESALDAITLRYNAIPTWGVGVSQILVRKILMTSAITDIYLFYDADVNQNIQTKRKLIKLFFGFGKNVHWIQSANDTDPNDLGFMESWNLIKSSKPITLTELYI